MDRIPNMNSTIRSQLFEYRIIRIIRCNSDLSLSFVYYRTSQRCSVIVLSKSAAACQDKEQLDLQLENMSLENISLSDKSDDEDDSSFVSDSAHAEIMSELVERWVVQSCHTCQAE